MLIISWNVAGWGSTLKRVNEFYPPPEACADGKSTKKRKIASNTSAALKHFCSLHKCDILCLQEHKFQKQQLSNRSEPYHASMMAKYESFWSCCVDKESIGFNGVCTYAPTGSVVAADSAPLGYPDLDSQGRCLMTDHGSFCIFNVYAPNAGGHPLSFKMRFHNALRRAMQKQRDNGKAVILVGDLNLKHQALDMHWQDRFVHIPDVLRQVEGTAQRLRNTLPRWKLDVAKHWGDISQCMEETREVIETKTQNSMTNETYDKFRLVITKNGRRIHLGSHESDPSYCTYGYDFGEDSYFDEDKQERVLCKEAGSVRVGILTELMAKIADVEWDETTQRSIEGGNSRLSPSRDWMSQLLSQDCMVDTFRHFYPTAQGRYTCWNQFTNRRYVNEGGRIDYVICDNSLLERIQKGGNLRCGKNQPADESDALTENSALCAATANGEYKPASFGGDGLQIPSKAALNAQFGEPHTGMIYTPPLFSDHIAVSVLLDNNDGKLLKSNLSLSNDAATRKSQPHKAQKSIASFFGGPAPTSSKGHTAGTARSKLSKQSSGRNVSKGRKKSSILDHFQQKTKGGRN